MKQQIRYANLTLEETIAQVESEIDSVQESSFTHSIQDPTRHSKRLLRYLRELKILRQTTMANEIALGPWRKEFA